MDKIKFLGMGSFPGSANTLDNLQSQIHLVALLAKLGGSDYILSGCEPDGEGKVKAGILVISGEILPFTGGTIKEYISIQETKQSLSAFGNEYPEAYAFRVAEFAAAGVQRWKNLKQVLSNTELQTRIESIKGDAPGTVKMWAGAPAKVPQEYMLCDGRDLLINDYLELYANIGIQYGGNEESFKLPDLRGQFIAGFDSADNDYKEIGKKGGYKEVTLTEEQIPPHKHIVPWGENLNTSWLPEWGYPGNYFNNSRGYKAETDNDNTWPFTSPTGGGKAHENRPPYFTLAYIIKVK